MCLNQCSKKGECVYDASRASVPFCECFEDYVGADCSLRVQKLNTGESFPLKIIPGSSILLAFKLSKADISFKLSELKNGSMTVYTKMINEKTPLRNQKSLGVQG